MNLHMVCLKAQVNNFAEYFLFKTADSDLKTVSKTRFEIAEVSDVTVTNHINVPVGFSLLSLCCEAGESQEKPGYPGIFSVNNMKVYDVCCDVMMNYMPFSTDVLSCSSKHIKGC